jgi:hypothetical protein
MSERCAKYALFLNSRSDRRYVYPAGWRAALRAAALGDRLARRRTRNLARWSAHPSNTKLTLGPACSRPRRWQRRTTCWPPPCVWCSTPESRTGRVIFAAPVMLVHAQWCWRLSFAALVTVAEPASLDPVAVVWQIAEEFVKFIVARVAKPRDAGRAYPVRLLARIFDCHDGHDTAAGGFTRWAPTPRATHRAAAPVSGSRHYARMRPDHRARLMTFRWLWFSARFSQPKS